MTAFEAVSARLGEIRYADVIAQVGDADVLAVHALTVAGAPVTMELAVVELWGGSSGWRRALACPGCRRPVRVLGVTEKGVGCARCIPRRTQQQLKKSTRAWAEAKEVDKLVRHALKGSVSGELIVLAHTLRSRGAERLRCALDSARLAIATADRTEDSSFEAASGNSFEEGDEVELNFEVPIGSQPSEEWARRREVAAREASSGHVVADDGWRC